MCTYISYIWVCVVETMSEYKSVCVNFCWVSVCTSEGLCVNLYNMSMLLCIFIMIIYFFLFDFIKSELCLFCVFFSSAWQADIVLLLDILALFFCLCFNFLSYLDHICPHPSILKQIIILALVIFGASCETKADNC